VRAEVQIISGVIDQFHDCSAVTMAEA
jgi:hypothetical protein